MDVEGLIEVEELLCSSSFPLSSSSEFLVGELLGCRGLFGRGDTEPRSDVEEVAELLVFVVGTVSRRGETGEVIVATGEKEEDDIWSGFNGSSVCPFKDPSLGLLTWRK